jgi:hypothetical protein
MKLAIPRYAFRADWFDWGRPATRDVIALFGGTLLLLNKKSSAAHVLALLH